MAGRRVWLYVCDEFRPVVADRWGDYAELFRLVEPLVEECVGEVLEVEVHGVCSGGGDVVVEYLVRYWRGEAWARVVFSESPVEALRLCEGG